MSIKIKRQKLIDPTKKSQKKRSAPSKPAKQTISAPTNANASSSAPPIEKSPSKAKYIMLAFIVLLAVVFPKPNLIKYQKLGVVNESIYWPGIPGVEAMLLDSNLAVEGNINTGNIHLCDKNNVSTGCQKYQIIEQKGFIASILHLISN